MPASANRTSRKPSTSAAGSRSAASTGGMNAFSTATTAATSSAPQKPSIQTPGRIPAATMNATPAATHDTMSGNRRNCGRSACQPVDSLAITSTSSVVAANLRSRTGGSHHPGWMKSVVLHAAWRLRRRSSICSRSVSQRDRAWAVTSSHWRWTSSSAGISPRRMRSSSTVDLPAGRCRADEHDHDAEERRDHGEHRADHAISGRERVEQVRDVHRRGDRVRGEQHRSEDAEREQIVARDPLGAEHPAAPDQEHRRQRRGEQGGRQLEAAAPE